MISIEKSWNVIERVVTEIAPVVARTLREGASERDIANLENEIGRKLPEDFRKSLLIHDGQHDPDRIHSLFNYNHLLSTKQMIDDYKMHKALFSDGPPIEWSVSDKIQNRIWTTGWVKFTESEGDGYMLDMSPAENGKVGQVFYRPHDDNSTEIKAGSFKEFLSQIAALLEAGKYEMDDGIVVIEDLE